MDQEHGTPDFEVLRSIFVNLHHQLPHHARTTHRLVNIPKADRDPETHAGRIRSLGKTRRSDRMVP